LQLVDVALHKMTAIKVHAEENAKARLR